MIVKEKLEDGRIKHYSDRNWYLFDSRIGAYYCWIILPFERNYEEVETIPEQSLNSSK